MTGPNSASYDPVSLRFHAKVTGTMTAIAALVFVVAPWAGVQGLALFFGSIATAQFVFYGGTLASVLLQGAQRRHFNVAVILGVPLVLAAVLLASVDHAPLSTLAAFATPWTLGGLAPVSWTPIL